MIFKHTLQKAVSSKSLIFLPGMIAAQNSVVSSLMTSESDFDATFLKTVRLNFSTDRVKEATKTKSRFKCFIAYNFGKVNKFGSETLHTNVSSRNSIGETYLPPLNQIPIYSVFTPGKSQMVTDKAFVCKDSSNSGSVINSTTAKALLNAENSHDDEFYTGYILANGSKEVHLINKISGSSLLFSH